ncbi:acetyltransferase [Aquibacillus koreensis]|uniref:Acetyltransferase n=1 Tax=Aquibacillus koreensis TaxID=279446 RepID=A0A9X3WHH8_9BACI|nr:acetyltransferase [Aquibacillus koreensis]MCT2534641.1 acetyltransferase [Aquibacillus koreensis]MDC3419825.1 acetyltransferase [Aquibacillus koreensis]
MSKKILLVGGGGHCKSVLDALLETNEYAEIGIIDKDDSAGKEILGVPIIGCDDDLPRLYQEEGFTHAFVTVGSLGNPNLRIKLFTVLEKIGFEIPNIVDPTAVVSRHSRLKKGIYIGKNAVVNAGSTIHKGAIINTSVLIEHDCIVEEFAHIAPGSVLCGDVHIGAGTHIGARSVIKQQIKVGSKTLIGMGSVVLCDIGSNIIAYGHPCKEV